MTSLTWSGAGINEAGRLINDTRQTSVERVHPVADPPMVDVTRLDLTSLHLTAQLRLQSRDSVVSRYSGT